jgi:hypothetical protein
VIWALTMPLLFMPTRWFGAFKLRRRGWTVLF